MARKAHQRRCQLDGMTDEAADKSFAVEVEPSLGSFCRSATSTPARFILRSFRSLPQAAELSGKRIGLFSYGSGCAAEFSLAG